MSSAAAEPRSTEEIATDAADPRGATPAPEEDVVQPADLEGVLAQVHTETPAGYLTLRPNQSTLDADQHAALLAIGVDTQNDPGVIPHLRVFVHMCQSRSLDPFAREAYLIGRGKGDKRKYTMQTGIDGYRKMAKATQRFIRVKKTLWTGSDDDDRSYIRERDDDGDWVMQRVWFDQWPAARGNPGAAKVVIEHYDDDGAVTSTSAVADWSMYAPYADAWEGYGSGRKKKMVDGKPVLVLNEMWTKGGAHMLAKCAEALAHRRAFPAAMSGIYVTEEMHRLDQQERDRTASDRSRARRDALAATRPSEPETVATEGTAPVTAAEAVAEVVEALPVISERSVEMLRTEFEWQATTLGKEPSMLATRRIKALGKELGEFTAEELFGLVNGYRSLAAQAASKAGDPLADLYAEAAQDGAPPFDIDSLALATGDDIVDAQVVAEPHLYIDASGQCWACGQAESEGAHVAPEVDGEER